MFDIRWNSPILKWPQIYKGEPTTCTIFIKAWGSKWGSSGFSCNVNNRGSTGVYVTCIYCGISMKLSVMINRRKTPHGERRSWTFVLCLFLRMWLKKPEDLQFEPYGGRRHCMGQYTRSGISLVYLWKWHKFPHIVSILQFCSYLQRRFLKYNTK